MGLPDADAKDWTTLCRKEGGGGGECWQAVRLNESSLILYLLVPHFLKQNPLYSWLMASCGLTPFSSPSEEENSKKQIEKSKGLLDDKAEATTMTTHQQIRYGTPKLAISLRWTHLKFQNKKPWAGQLCFSNRALVRAILEAKR